MKNAVATAVETADRAAGQSPVQPLDERQRFQVERADVLETLIAFGRLRRLQDCFHG